MGKEILNELAQAANDKRWFDAGKLLNELESGDPPENPEDSWLKLAIKATGYQMNMLRKMQRAQLFAESFSNMFPVDELKAAPLSHVEVLAMTVTIDHERGMELLEKYLRAERNISYRELLNVYTSIRRDAVNLGSSEVKRARQTISEFRRICLQIISGQDMLEVYSKLCRERPPELSVRVWKGGHPITSPYATVRRRNSDHLRWDEGGKEDQRDPLTGVDGIECFMQYDDDEPDLARRRLLAAASEATLFDLFWLFLPDSGTRSYERLAERFWVPNLGILRVDTAAGKIVDEMLPSGLPVPDRRDLWSDSERRYLARDLS